MKAAFQRVFQVIPVTWRLPLAVAVLLRELFPDRKTRWQAIGCLSVPAFFLLAGVAYWSLFIWFMVPVGVFTVRCERQALATLGQQHPSAMSAYVSSFRSQGRLSNQMWAEVRITWYNPPDHITENTSYRCQGTPDHFSLDR